MFTPPKSQRAIPIFFTGVWAVIPGIFPDMMHICHLAVYVDVITSCLLDWSDSPSLFFNGSSREKRLTQLYENYRRWCESQSFDLTDRAGRKLFSSKILQPDAGRFVEVSQKVLSATASRYFILWLSSIAKQFAEWRREDPDMILRWKKPSKATFSHFFGFVSLRKLLKGPRTRQIHWLRNIWFPTKGFHKYPWQNSPKTVSNFFQVSYR